MRNIFLEINEIEFRASEEKLFEIMYKVRKNRGIKSASGYLNFSFWGEIIGKKCEGNPMVLLI